MANKKQKNNKTKHTDLVLETVQLDKQIKRLIDRYNTNRAKLQKYFDDNNVDELTVFNDMSVGKESYKVKKISRVYVSYDPVKLKSKLSKDIYKDVTVKEYKIKNINGLIKLLRESGVSPKKFKAFLDITTIVDKAKVNELFSIGKIKQRDLEGCYDAKVVKSIQIREKAGD